MGTSSLISSTSRIRSAFSLCALLGTEEAPCNVTHRCIRCWTGHAHAILGATHLLRFELSCITFGFAYVAPRPHPNTYMLLNIYLHNAAAVGQGSKSKIEHRGYGRARADVGVGLVAV